jgi:predicted nucleotidyltransferase
MASGRFDEKSDIDLLVLGEERDVDRDRVLAIQEKLGIPVQLTVLPWHSFETLKEKNDPFLRTVLENYVLISGSGL